MACEAGKLKAMPGDAPCALCPAGTVSMAGSTDTNDCTAIPATTVPVLKMTLRMPMTVSEFTQDKQDGFRQAIARVLDVDGSKVRIVNIKSRSNSRRLLAESIEVVTEIDRDGDTSKVAAMKSKLTISNINLQLSKANLPEAEMVQAPTLQESPVTEQANASSAQNTTTNTTVPLIAGCVAGAVVLLCGLSVWILFRRKFSRQTCALAEKLVTIPRDVPPVLTADSSAAGSAVGVETRSDASVTASRDNSARRTRSVDIAWKACGDQVQVQQPRNPLDAPSRCESSSVRMDVLDFEPDDIAASTSMGSPPRANSLASSEASKIRSAEDLPVLQAAGPEAVAYTASNTARAFKKFSKEKISDVLMIGPVSAAEQQAARHGRLPTRLSEDEARNRNLSPDIYTTAGSFDILASGHRSVDSQEVNGLASPPLDTRSQATVLIAQMREQGLLPGATARLVVLQPKVQESKSVAVGQVAASLASHRLKSLGNPALPAPWPLLVAAAMEPGVVQSIRSGMEASVSSGMGASVSGTLSPGFGGSSQPADSSLTSHTSSLKLLGTLLPGVPQSETQKTRPPPIDACTSGSGPSSSTPSTQSAGTAYHLYLLAGPQCLNKQRIPLASPEKGAERWAASQAIPLEPQSPHLDDREPITPPSDLKPPTPEGANPRPTISQNANTVKLPGLKQEPSSASSKKKSASSKKNTM